MSGKWLIASRKRRLINGHCASRSRHRVSSRHEHPQEYISDDACAVEDGQCDERNPNPCHADAQVQGDALAHAGEPTALPGARQRHARGQQWFGR